jgi:dTDP-4-amino-4,6-dideoxygalactose transaminase
MDTWNMPNRRRNAGILMDALSQQPEIKYLPIDTEERRNGWYTMAFSLDVENMDCDIEQFVKAAVAEGAPCWKVFWPQCHKEKAFRDFNSFGNSRFPFRSQEYTNPTSVDYSRVEVPNAVWHESHTFTVFAFPTFSEGDMHQISYALVKVIDRYSLRKHEASRHAVSA